jgi:hypothetical protein
VWTRGTCCPRLTPPRGARYKSTPKTQVFKTSREPLGPLSFNAHPASFTRPTRSVLQSSTLGLVGQGVGGGDFSSFVRPALPATPSSYWTSGAWSREVFPNFSPLDHPPPFPATALQHISLSNPRQPRSEAFRPLVLTDGSEGGAKYKRPFPPSQPPRSARRAGRRGSVRVLSSTEGAAARNHQRRGE